MFGLTEHYLGRLSDDTATDVGLISSNILIQCLGVSMSATTSLSSPQDERIKTQSVLTKPDQIDRAHLRCGVAYCGKFDYETGIFARRAGVSASQCRTPTGRLTRTCVSLSVSNNA